MSTVDCARAAVEWSILDAVREGVRVMSKPLMILPAAYGIASLETLRVSSASVGEELNEAREVKIRQLERESLALRFDLHGAVKKEVDKQNAMLRARRDEAERESGEAKHELRHWRRVAQAPSVDEHELLSLRALKRAVDWAGANNVLAPGAAGTIADVQRIEYRKARLELHATKEKVRNNV